MDVWIDAVISVVQLETLLLIAMGSIIGVVIGVLPGLGAVQGIALVLPLTFGMDAASALVLLGSIYGGSTYGGAITAILINTPGDPTSAATIFDGYPMAKRGEGGLAIGAATGASVVGGLAGIAVLAGLGPYLASLAVKVGSPDYFALGVVGLAIIGATTVSGESVLRGMASAGIGLLLSFVGFSQVIAFPRYVFGSSYLLDGVPFIALTVGLFAISEALSLIRNETSTIAQGKSARGGVLTGFLTSFRYGRTLVRSAGIGLGVGILPGVGGATANFISYGAEIRASKRPQDFGKGKIEGVIAAEASNNAVVGASLVPALTLGIPGSAGAAILLGGIVLYGLTPGPSFYNDPGGIAQVFIVGLFLSTWAFAVVGLVSANAIARVTRVPVSVLAPLIIVLSCVAAYATRQSIGDVFVAVLGGIAGYVARANGFSLVALMIGFVLGPILESSFVRSMVLSEGAWTIFVTRPLALAFLLVAALIIGFQLRSVAANESSEEFVHDEKKF